MEMPQGGEEAERKSKGKTEARIFIEVSKEKSRQGRVNSLGLTSLNNFLGL